MVTTVRSALPALAGVHDHGHTFAPCVLACSCAALRCTTAFSKRLQASGERKAVDATEKKEGEDKDGAEKDGVCCRCSRKTSYAVLCSNSNQQLRWSSHPRETRTETWWVTFCWSLSGLLHHKINHIQEYAEASSLSCSQPLEPAPRMPTTPRPEGPLAKDVGIRKRVWPWFGLCFLPSFPAPSNFPGRRTSACLVRSWRTSARSRDRVLWRGSQFRLLVG